MHTIKNFLVLSALVLFGIVGAISLSKAEENIDTEREVTKLSKDLLKSLLDSKPVPKPKRQNLDDIAVAEETLAKNMVHLKFL